MKLVYEPRAWQIEALTLWKRQLRGTVSVVTGGGKTVFAEACIQHFLTHHPDGGIVILVPTIALQDQWELSLQDELGIAPEMIASIGAMSEAEQSRPFLLCTLASGRRRGGSWFSDNRPTMLIVDECHRAGSPENSKALDGSFAATLGLSATPKREYDAGFEDRVVPALGPIIFEYDYIQAHADGILSPFRLHHVRVPLLEDEAEQYQKLTRRIAALVGKVRAGDATQDQLDRALQARAAVSVKAAMRLPVAASLVERHRGERAVIFHERVAEANTLVSNLMARHHSVALYHAGLAPAIRRQNLKLYRRGIVDTLVCCRALDEGMNVPETTIAIIAASTASSRQRIQRLGRVLRPSKGKESAIVYTLYATDEEEARLIAESERMSGIAETIWHSAGVKG